eukprot:6192362-Pleurochrysis_carterae.AAC.1
MRTVQAAAPQAGFVRRHTHACVELTISCARRVCFGFVRSASSSCRCATTCRSTCERARPHGRTTATRAPPRPT